MFLGRVWLIAWGCRRAVGYIYHIEINMDTLRKTKIVPEN